MKITAAPSVIQKMTLDPAVPPPPVLGAPLGVVTRGVADGVGHPPVAGDADEVQPVIPADGEADAEADGSVEAASDGD